MFVEVTFFSKKDLLILNLDFEKKAVKSMQQKKSSTTGNLVVTVLHGAQVRSRKIMKAYILDHVTS